MVKQFSELEFGIKFNETFLAEDYDFFICLGKIPSVPFGKTFVSDEVRKGLSVLTTPNINYTEIYKALMDLSEDED